MKTKKFAAAALLAVAATGVTAVTANAAPAPAAPARISYTTAWAPDHSTLTATLSSGRFQVTPTAVDILAANGAVLAQVPTTYPTVRLTPRLAASGSTVTLTSDRPVAQPLHDISAGSTIGGAAIGCVVGALIGLIFFGFGAIPGCLIGAVIGGIIGAGQ